MTNREIDALVAENIMGWRSVIYDNNLDEATGWYLGIQDHVRDYSNDIEHAWRVAEKLTIHPNISLHIYKSHQGLKSQAYTCSFNKGRGTKIYTSYAESAPKAICLAALKVVGVEALEKVK